MVTWYSTSNLGSWNSHWKQRGINSIANNSLRHDRSKAPVVNEWFRNISWSTIGVFHAVPTGLLDRTHGSIGWLCATVPAARKLWSTFMDSWGYLTKLNTRIWRPWGVEMQQLESWKNCAAHHHQCLTSLTLWIWSAGCGYVQHVNTISWDTMSLLNHFDIYNLYLNWVVTTFH